MLLWILALIALFQRRTIGTALFAIFWGFCVAMLGYMQQGILAGSDLHWVVRVVHLAIGLLALGLAEQLAPARRVEATMTTAAV